MGTLLAASPARVDQMQEEMRGLAGVRDGHGDRLTLSFCFPAEVLWGTGVSHFRQVQYEWFKRIACAQALQSQRAV